MKDRAGVTGGPAQASRVALIGILSGVLYLVGYLAQWAIFRNGKYSIVAGGLFTGAPHSRWRLLLELGVYFLATVLLFALYWRLVVLCRRGSLDGRARTLALAFPVLFNLALLFGRPYQSIDSLTYIVHGYLGSTPGFNPYLSAAAEVAYVSRATDFVWQLASYGWIPVHGPSPYGALWTQLEILIFKVSGSVPVALLMIKAIVVAASLGCAALIWAILGRVRPEDQLLGTLLYLWNPLVIVEFAAEGHNDSLMVLCLLAALALAVVGRPGSSLFTLWLGVLIKYLPAMFLPAQLFYLWRARRSTARFGVEVCVAGCASLLLGVALFAPLWIGNHTFDALRLQALQSLRLRGMPFAVPSPSGVFYWLLAFVYPPEVAAQVALRTLGVVFALVAIYVGWRERGETGLFRACAVTSLVYLLVVSAGTWPWYTSLPLALIALTPRGGILPPIALTLTLCSRLAAPSSNLLNNGFMGREAAILYQTLLSVTVPLIVLVVLYLRRRDHGKQRAKE